MGGLDDFQRALEPLKRIVKKLKYIFMTILGQANRLKRITGPVRNWAIYLFLAICYICSIFVTRSTAR